MMITHATVATRLHEWPNGVYTSYRNLYVDGKWFALPACFEGAKAGDVLAVLSPHELALIETYRRHCPQK